MAEDRKPTRRAQSASDRDLQSPKLGLKPSHGEVEALADEADSDGTPAVKLGPDQEITPKPFDVSRDPELSKVWDHATKRYLASVNHINEVAMQLGVAPEQCDRIDAAHSQLEDQDKRIGHLDLKVGWALKIVGVVSTMALGALGGVMCKLYGAGVDEGRLRAEAAQVQVMARENRDAIADLVVTVYDLRRDLAAHVAAHPLRPFVPALSPPKDPP